MEEEEKYDRNIEIDEMMPEGIHAEFAAARKSDQVPFLEPNLAKSKKSKKSKNAPEPKSSAHSVINLLSSKNSRSVSKKSERKRNGTITQAA